jgi:hypothetical protein
MRILAQTSGDFFGAKYQDGGGETLVCSERYCDKGVHQIAFISVVFGTEEPDEET